MKRMLLAIGLCLALPTSLAGATPPPPPGMPSPARCPTTPPLDAELNEREGPLHIPPRMAALIRSSRTSIAVWTLGNANFCHAIANVSDARNFATSADFRFIEFDWFGYEEGGHFVIDRTGRGQLVDTGAKPLFSPSRRQMAAIEWSESGFGSLNGFAIWQINPVGLRRTVMIEQIPSLTDWRIDGWAGEACINLSGVRQQDVPEVWSNLPKARRMRYVARPAGRAWALTPMPGGCPAR
jgi:hypothetical protein